MKRVAVTGLGLVTPLGLGVKNNWDCLLSAKSGIDYIRAFDASKESVTFAGEIKEDLGLDSLISKKEARRFDPFIHFAIFATHQAIQDSGLSNSDIDPRYAGVCIGSGIGGLETMETNIINNYRFGAKKVSPFYVPGAIINMASGMVSILQNFKGPNVAPVSACTTGAHALAWATRLIQCEDAKVMIAGGAEHAVTLSGLAGFGATRALSKRNDAPQKASRPWDIDRDGFVLSDGSGIVILEEMEFAKKRGASIYGEVIGVGMSGDAHHITLPSEDGSGATWCMQQALNNAKIDAQKLGYINAHGTSTPAGDALEIKAIKSVFGNHSDDLTVSSSKSMTGHTLGAAGAIEAIITLLSLKHQKVVPTINLDNPAEGCDLDLVPHRARDIKLDYAMSNSFGFGGSNCSLVFAKI